MLATQDTPPGPEGSDGPDEGRYVPGLVVIYSADEPWRVGEVILLLDSSPRTELIFGRGAAVDDELRAKLVQQRPGINTSSPALETPTLSRAQAKIARTPRGLADTLIPRGATCDRQLRVNGEPCEGWTALLSENDTVAIWGSDCKIAFLCVRGPRVMPPMDDRPAR